jgi:hypothetical protein
MAYGMPLWPCPLLRADLDLFPESTPIISLTEPVYGYLLLVSYHLFISLSVVETQQLGPVTPERILAAKELCRQYTVLQVHPPECFDMPILSSLRSEGITFGPTPHPKGNSSQASDAEYKDDLINSRGGILMPNGSRFNWMRFVLIIWRIGALIYRGMGTDSTAGLVNGLIEH